MKSEAFQYPTRLGRAAKCRAALLFLAAKKRHGCCHAAKRLSSSATAAALAVDVAVQVGDLALRGGEELLQLILEGLLGRNALHALLGAGCGSGTALAALIVVEGAGLCLLGPGAALGRGALGLGQSLLDGEIDLAVLGGQDQNLDLLAFLHEIMHVVDEGICHLRNVNQTGLSIRQSNKSAKLRNPRDLTV